MYDLGSTLTHMYACTPNMKENNHTIIRTYLLPPAQQEPNPMVFPSHSIQQQQNGLAARYGWGADQEAWKGKIETIAPFSSINLQIANPWTCSTSLADMPLALAALPYYTLPLPSYAHLTNSHLSATACSPYSVHNSAARITVEPNRIDLRVC